MNQITVDNFPTLSLIITKTNLLCMYLLSSGTKRTKTILYVEYKIQNLNCQKLS